MVKNKKKAKRRAEKPIGPDKRVVQKHRVNVGSRLVIISIVIMIPLLMQYKEKVEFMNLLQEKQVNYEDDINMTLRIIKDDDRFINAGDRARQWLLHYFNYQRQVRTARLLLTSHSCELPE